MSKTTLGVIGGLGPIATSYFMELIIQMTDAKTDQEHLDMIIYNQPSIPDRTSYILDKSSPNPLPPIISLGKKLVEQKVGYIAIPCVTAHSFIDELTSEITAPIIDIVAETARHLKENHVTYVGIMATDGTIATRLFQNAFEANGIQPIIPTKEEQQMVMDLIYRCVKAGEPVDIQMFNRVKAALMQRGAQTVLLGCTELSLIKRDYDTGAGIIDAMEVLARQCVLNCGGNIKKEYDCLITK